jgi:hypothetical protein
MTFRIDHEFLLIGKPSTGFSKNYFYEWDDGLGGHKSQLVLNIYVDSEEIPGPKVGQAIFDVMKNYFFHDLSRDEGDRFEDMLKEINKEVNDQEEALGESIVPHVHVVAAVISGDVLYLSQRGDAEAYLIRRRYVSSVSDGLSDPKNKHELFQNIANGELAAGDYVVFCSTRLLRYITKPDLGRLFSGGAALPMAMEAIDDAVSVDLMDHMSLSSVQVGEREVTVIDGDSSDQANVPVGNRAARVKEWGTSLKLKLGALVPTRKGESTDSGGSEVEEGTEFEENLDTHRESVRAEVKGSMKGPSEFSQLIQEWKDLKRDRILMILTAVVVLLIGGIYLVRNQGQKQHFVEGLESKLATAELNINTSRTTGAYDKDTALTLLIEAEELSLEVLNSGYLRGKASEYLSEIEVQRDRLDSVRRIIDPEVFVDFAMVNPEMNALGITAMEDNVYVFEHDKLYEIILDQIQTPVTIDSNEVVIDAAYFDDRESLFFLTKANRVIEYVDGQFAFVDTSDSAWRNGVDIEIFNNRIYLLDPSSGQIWRYYQQRNGFSGADAYIADTEILKDAVSFSIDGSIYVLNQDGSLIKLLSGEVEENFDVRKAPGSDLSGATVLNTEFEMFQTFVLDPAESRVLIYNKDSRTGDLVYASQFVLENAEELRDIHVDKEASRLYVLGKTKVYEVPY